MTPLDVLNKLEQSPRLSARVFNLLNSVVNNQKIVLVEVSELMADWHDWAESARTAIATENDGRAALIEALDLARSWAWEVSDEKIDGEGTRAEYAKDMETINAVLKT